MKQILENEINKIIGRFPDQDELQSAINYLENHTDSDTTAEDIKYLLGDWRSDCMVRCVNCGKYFLANNIIQTPQGHFCGEYCMYDYENETYNMHAEARAEYECANR